MSNQNISQSNTTNNHLPASMRPIPVSKSEITGLVAWVASAGKVSYLDASMVLETAVINAAIKLGLIVEQDNYLILAGLVEQVVTHTQTHLVQTSNHYTDCGFFEALPTTNNEVLAAIFGEASKLKPLTSQEKALVIANTQNKHAQIADEIRKDLAELEQKYGKQAQEQAQTQQQNPQLETKVFPMFKGLSLKNANRCEKDGYLLYVGSRKDCVLAASQYQKGSVKANSKDGHSWKFILSLKDFNSLSSTHTFNFKQFAIDAVQAYRTQQISFLEEIATY